MGGCTVQNSICQFMILGEVMIQYFYDNIIQIVRQLQNVKSDELQNIHYLYHPFF